MAAPGDNEAASRQAATIWLGIAVGAAVGLGIAMARRKKDRWDSARGATLRAAGGPGVSGVTRELVARARKIHEESCKVVDDAGLLWSRGRKLAGQLNST